MTKYFKMVFLMMGALMVFQCTGVFGKNAEKSQSTTNFVLTVSGDSIKKIEFTEQDLSKFSHYKFSATDHHGETHAYEGILVYDILSTAGVKLGEQLRGKMLRKYLEVDAKDGYKVIFALPEIDPLFTDKKIYLVNLEDGKPLAKDEGPMRLVIPDEKRQARWIRMITGFKINSMPE
jgi:hypothetical protein